jgi:hypothetical protein
MRLARPLAIIRHPNETGPRSALSDCTLNSLSPQRARGPRDEGCFKPEAALAESALVASAQPTVNAEPSAATYKQEAEAT